MASTKSGDLEAQDDSSSSSSGFSSPQLQRSVSTVIWNEPQTMQTTSFRDILCSFFCSDCISFCQLPSFIVPERCKKIELKLTTVFQLFVSLDPSPFYDRDIDGQAEEFIVECAREDELATSFCIAIHLEQTEGLTKSRLELPELEDGQTKVLPVPQHMLSLPQNPRLVSLPTPEEENLPALQLAVGSAIQKHFLRKARRTRQELWQLLRKGRLSLLIGLCLLILVMLANQLTLDNDSAWMEWLSTSMTIAGWVAIWYPCNVFLYDWWPYYQDKILYQRLASAVVFVKLMKRTPLLMPYPPSNTTIGAP